MKAMRPLMADFDKCNAIFAEIFWSALRSKAVVNFEKSEITLSTAAYEPISEVPVAALHGAAPAADLIASGKFAIINVEYGSRRTT